MQAAADHDPELAGLAARLAELAHLTTDVAGELASYLASVDADPARLGAAQERLAALTALVRRHAVPDVDGVLAWAARASDRLLELDGADDRIAALEQQDAELEASLGVLAAELSTARTAAALRFGEAVTAELAELAMPHARVTAEVTQRAADDGLPVGDAGAGRRSRRRRRGRAAARAPPRRSAPGAAEGRLGR